MAINKKLVIILFSSFFFNCNNYHQESFNKLYDAFTTWHYQNHLIENHYLLLSINYNHINTNIIDEYLEDLKRFMLELSQINKNNLSKNFFYNIADKGFRF